MQNLQHFYKQHKRKDDSMGKKTGFLEYQRVENTTKAATKRTQDFQEFHLPLEMSLRRQQASRCMNCGVPFCQSGMLLDNMVTGCPLHNLIPEWNDLLYQGQYSLALERLLKTNNFPEFTSRVCPAPCEMACTCNLEKQPVTIRDNEYAIIEEAYRTQQMKQKKIQRNGKHVAIIGSGPSGLTLADQLNHMGYQVCIYEQADRAGGLLMYGIPNMKLDKAIIQRRISLMEKEGVVFQLQTRIDTKKAAEALRKEYDAIALACGSRVPRDLKIENKDAKGIHFAVPYLSEATASYLEHREASINALGKHVVVVGGGDTGNDCVATALRQGCASILQLEMMAKPPCEIENAWPKWPLVWKVDYGQEEAIACFGKDPRRFQTTIKRCIVDEAQHVKQVELVELKQCIDPQTKQSTLLEKKDSNVIVNADLVLIAAGFLGCETEVTNAFGVDCENGRVMVQNYQTNQENIFSLGDQRRGQSLVVWAIKEGRECAKAIHAFLSK